MPVQYSPPAKKEVVTVIGVISNVLASVGRFGISDDKCFKRLVVALRGILYFNAQFRSFDLIFVSLNQNRLNFDRPNIDDWLKVL